MSDNLPPLPMAFATLHHDDGYFTMLKRDDNMGRVFRTNVFTAEQMHAYVEADRVSRDVPTDLSLPMFVSRLENMERNGDKWLTVQAVLALLSDCQYLESLTASPQPQPVQAQPSEAEKLMGAAGLCRRCAAPLHEQLPPDYMLAKLQMVMPLFQEARDVMPAISVVAMKLHGISPTLADRMDAAGTFSLADWEIAQPKPTNQQKE